MTTPLRAWMPNPGDDALVPALRARLDERLLHLAVGPERPAAYDVLVAGRPTEEDLDACETLRVLVVPWAGLPPTTRERLRARPRIEVHNLHHNAVPTGEMAIALLLAAARRVVPLDQALREGDWRPRYRPEARGVLLAGRRLLVLGLGAIGRHVARVGQALGMTVAGIRRDPASRRGDPAGVAVHPPDALDEQLGGADALVVCVPSTEATRGLLDARRLARLPDGAILVNVARGDVIDAAALHAGLLRGRPAAAGLDVWWRYPEDEAARASTPPADVPLAALDQVVLSPHRAGLADGVEALRAAHLARLLLALAGRGEQPRPVDLEAGY